MLLTTLYYFSLYFVVLFNRVNSFDDNILDSGELDDVSYVQAMTQSVFGRRLQDGPKVSSTQNNNWYLVGVPLIKDKRTSIPVSKLQQDEHNFGASKFTCDEELSESKQTPFTKVDPVALVSHHTESYYGNTRASRSPNIYERVPNKQNIDVKNLKTRETGKVTKNNLEVESTNVTPKLHRRRKVNHVGRASNIVLTTTSRPETTTASVPDFVTRRSKFNPDEIYITTSEPETTTYTPQYSSEPETTTYTPQYFPRRKVTTTEASDEDTHVTEEPTPRRKSFSKPTIHRSTVSYQSWSITENKPFNDLD